MIKKILLSLIILSGFESKAQVGINTTTPKAQLEIKSTNEATPANTDGLLIPKINAFPVTNPTADQQGMLVYLTTTIGANTPGFYFWNNPTTAWLPVKGTDGGTLDQAYDFGGAGNGRTITADTGAVTIAGTDGLVSSGQFNTGAFAPDASPLVPRMFWNPRKAAFRAGYSQTSSWTDINIGSMSVAFGFTTTASGGTSTAFGSFTTASGGTSTAFGSNTTASGTMSTSFGEITSASGSVATAFGRNNSASSFGETVLGIGATTYTPSTNGATQFRAANETDRLFVIGNAIDANNNNTVDLAERSDAMVVLKNGNVGVGISTPQNRLHFHNPTGFQTFMQLTNSTTGSTDSDGMILGNIISSGEAGIVNFENTNFYIGTAGDSNQVVLTPAGNLGIGTTGANERLEVQGNIRMVDGNQGAGKVLTSDANGTATWTTPGAGTAGTLDQSYDFGGAGAGRTITADTGAVTIAGTDGLVSTGTINSGVLVPNGAGTRMVWNPRRAAFRVGNVMGTQWDEANVGQYSTGFGLNSIASGTASVAFGSGNQATGGASVAFGSGNQASGEISTAFGNGNVASGNFSVSIGSSGSASGTRSITLGQNNIARSFGEIALGIGNTDYTPSTNGATQFTTANETDRLFVIGNAIDTNLNGVLDDSERRNAMVVLKNGNAGIGVSTPGERLQVAGRALFTDGFSSDNAALLYRNDTDYMFLGPQSGSSADGGALALFGSTNTAGGNAGGVDFNVPGSQVRMNHTNGSYTFRANSTSGYAATFELNDTGLQIGHNSASRAIVFNTASTERMRLTAGGDFGIGTTTPARRLHVATGTSGATPFASSNVIFESNGDSYQQFLTPNASAATGAGLLFGTPVGSIRGGIVYAPLAESLDFRTGGNNRRMTITNTGNVGIGTTAPGGQFELSLNEGRKPGSNAWTVVSDQRLKNVNGLFTKGLNEIIQLNPIRYHYKNNGERKFEEQVLNTEFTGFLAQEVQPLFPEAVGTDADGFLNFNIHPILIASINAFKELDLKNQAVENKNRELELKLQSQEQIINSLIERLEKLETKN